MKGEAYVLHCRRSIAWMNAWLECLDEGRPVSVLRTEMQLRGLLI